MTSVSKPAVKDVLDRYQALDDDGRREFLRIIKADDAWTPTDEQRELIERRLHEIQTGAVEPLNEEQMWERVSTLRKRRTAGK